MSIKTSAATSRTPDTRSQACPLCGQAAEYYFVNGQTPKHFLLACQIHRAKQMLVERKQELSEIAKECGFAHQSHFTSRFKQATGLTPTRWRRLAADLERAATSGAAR